MAVRPAFSASRSAGAAALGSGLTLAGGAFDSPSLYVPGLVLLALGLGAAAWVWLAARGARVVRELGPQVIEEGEPYPVRVRFRAGVLRPPGGELVEPLLGEPVPLTLVRQRTLTREIRFGRRGRRVLDAGRVAIADPLALALRERPLGEPAEVIVLPRVEPVRAVDGDGAGERLGELGIPLGSAASQIELDSLRRYREGAPASRIHWPSVARSGELMERNLIGADENRPVVVCDLRAPASDEALDMAVRAAASLAFRLARDGGCGLLLPGDRSPAEIAADLRGWPAQHLRLALAQESAEPPAAARLQRIGAVYWVRAAAGERVPAGLNRAAASVRYLVSPPGATPPGAPRFTVAGCLGIRLARGRMRGAA